MYRCFAVMRRYLKSRIIHLRSYPSLVDSILYLGGEISALLKNLRFSLRLHKGKSILSRVLLRSWKRMNSYSRHCTNKPSGFTHCVHFCLVKSGASPSKHVVLCVQLPTILWTLYCDASTFDSLRNWNLSQLLTGFDFFAQPFPLHQSATRPPCCIEAFTLASISTLLCAWLRASSLWYFGTMSIGEGILWFIHFLCCYFQ